MSNPAVLSLASLEKNEEFNGRFEIEDNIGEAVHVHYKDIRLDLTVKEFYEIAGKMGTIIDELVTVDGFSCKDFDPYRLMEISGELINLKKITYDEMYLEEMYISEEETLKESQILKMLKDEVSHRENETQVNYYDPDKLHRQTDMERLQYNLCAAKSQKVNPENAEILMLNDSSCIFDGEQTAACLYELYGNVKVKVKRLWFEGGKYGKKEQEKSEDECCHLDMEEQPQVKIEKRKKVKNIYLNMATAENGKEKYKVSIRRE